MASATSRKAFWMVRSYWMRACRCCDSLTRTPDLIFPAVNTGTDTCGRKFHVQLGPENRLLKSLLIVPAAPVRVIWGK